jgi:DNA polymerase III subunit epsilon
MKKIFFDTETTGKLFTAGHKIVEIAAVVLNDDGTLGDEFHSYINPGRDIPEDVIKIHGITNEKVADAPRFKDVIDKFLQFIEGAELYAHNADFDENFIAHEMTLCNHNKTLWEVATKVIDTLPLSRRIDSKESRHTLDAILDRYKIDRSERTQHNALLDCKLLALAYIKMIQNAKEKGFNFSAPTVEDNIPRAEIKKFDKIINVLSVNVTNEEIEKHEKYCDDIFQESNKLIWSKNKQKLGLS